MDSKKREEVVKLQGRIEAKRREVARFKNQQTAYKIALNSLYGALG